MACGGRIAAAGSGAADSEPGAVVSSRAVEGVVAGKRIISSFCWFSNTSRLWMSWRLPIS